jgi:hypothetical protein
VLSLLWACGLVELAASGKKCIHMHVASGRAKHSGAVISTTLHARILACFGNPHNIRCLHFGTLCHDNSPCCTPHLLRLCPSFFCVLAHSFVRDIAEQTESPRRAPSAPFSLFVDCDEFFVRFSFCMRPTLLLPARRLFVQTPELPRRLPWNTVSNPSPWIQTLTRSLATTRTSLTPTPQRSWYVCCALPFPQIRPVPLARMLLPTDIF